MTKPNKGAKFSWGRSLDRKTLIQISIPITGAIIMATLMTYRHAISKLETQTVVQLEKYIVPRVQRESKLFKLVEDNHKTLKEEFLNRYEATEDIYIQQEFKKRYETLPNGNMPLRSDFYSGIQTVNGQITQWMSGYAAFKTPVTPELKRRLVVAHDLVSIYGPAWSNRFENLYVFAPENASSVYWPGVQVLPNDATQEEFFYIADAEHNPSRTKVWTGLYYDIPSKAFMVSCETPVDLDGRHLVTIGTDILVNDLFERTIDDHIPGAYNLILRTDGRLIAHPEWMEAIQEKSGLFNMLESGNDHLIRIFKLVNNLPDGQVVIENTQDNEYLAIVRIEGPDWYFVTVYPKSLLLGSALDTARFMLILGCLTLLIQLLVLLLVLRHQVAKPLKRLTNATEEVAGGNFDVQLDTARQDELGQLAFTFKSMAGQLKESFETLEDKVKERTTELAWANKQITALNAKLKAENLRMEAELNVARQIQQMILPKPEELASIEGLDLAGFMEPADEIGGDYYDVLQTDGIVTLGIGDVTGHGLESGLLMLMTQTAVRILQEIREQDPVRFLDTLNRTLYRNVQRMNSDKNLTLAILNYSEGRVSISGQHEETLVVRSGGHIERIDTMDLGLPIGLDDDIADFIDHIMVELHPGDGVVLYTDGIPEAFNLDKKQYGLERLCKTISQNWQHTAQEIKQAVIDDLRAFIGQQKVFDDITLVILKQQ